MFEVWWKGVKCSSVVSQSTGYICWLACLLLKWFQFKFSFLCLLLLISVHPSKGARHNSNKQISLPNQKNLMLGSCCGSVGRAVAFDTRGLRFKSSHWQKLNICLLSTGYWKDKNKEKEAGMAHFFKKNLMFGPWTDILILYWHELL